MKTFSCREIMNNESGCDVSFSGDSAMEVAMQCGKHVATTTDEDHKGMREKMTSSTHTEDDRKKWFEWFNGEWEKK